MPAILSLLQQVTAANKQQLIVFKGYGARKVAEAVERLSGETGRPVQRLAFSTLESKFLAETEKALQAVLESAKGTDAILFFEEADALFGRRTNVKDAHDRYANRKTAYLLQRLEEHDGLVVLTTNKKRELHKPFLRRYRCIQTK